MGKNSAIGSWFKMRQMLIKMRLWNNFFLSQEGMVDYVKTYGWKDEKTFGEKCDG